MANDHERVWDVIEKVRVGMLTTRSDQGFRARPLDARPDKEAGIIWFVTDARSHKVEQINNEHDVCLTFIDDDSRAYLSITGRGSIKQDTLQAQKIWKNTEDVWWPDGPGDANVRVLRVEPHTAELWDGPESSAVAAFEFAKAKLTGDEPNLGQNRKLTVQL